MGSSLSGPLGGRVVPLDGLRGIAILMVMVVHCIWVQPNSAMSGLVHHLMPGMLLGVDLFFVLSGYLITGILLRTRDEPGYFREFYIRRVLRILPAYYLVLALIWLVLPAIDARVHQSHLHAQTFWYLLHMQNWLMALGIDSGWAGVNHLWSLAVEEQFYLCWPLVVALTPRERLRSLCLVLFAICVATKLAFAATHAPWTMIYMGTLTRYDGLVIGAFIATWRPQDLARFANVAGAAGIVAGLGILATVIASPDERTAKGITIETTLAAIAFGAAVLRVHVQAPSWTGGLLASRPLVWLGRYSYGIYLLHLPLNFLVWPFVASHGLLLGWPVNLRNFAVGSTTIAISLIAARVMYQLLEGPALSLRHRNPRPPIAEAAT